jgi:hypothetical protein
MECNVAIWLVVAELRIENSGQSLLQGSVLDAPEHLHKASIAGEVDLGACGGPSDLTVFDADPTAPIAFEHAEKRLHDIEHRDRPTRTDVHNVTGGSRSLRQSDDKFRSIAHVD